MKVWKTPLVVSCGLIVLYGDCLYMRVTVTSVDSELDCETETHVGDHSTTELLTLVTVNYIQYKFFCLSVL